MGETVSHATVRDAVRVRRAGRLVWHDATRLTGSVPLERPAIAAGGRAVATIVHAAVDADTRLETLRAALAGENVEAGASAWDGLLVARIVAADGAAARAAVIAGVQCLREGRPLPRVWMC
jgi:urease accessory protein